MKPFADSSHCRSRLHCETCRASSVWRRLVGAPDVCPHDGRPAAMEAIPATPCAGCGGKSLTDLRGDPAAMEKALAGE